MNLAFIHTVLAQKLLAGALSGWLAAAVVDVHAFQQWKSFHDAAVYDWGTATFRWVQGAVAGAIMAGGLFQVS